MHKTEIMRPNVDWWHWWELLQISNWQSHNKNKTDTKFTFLIITIKKNYYIWDTHLWELIFNLKDIIYEMQMHKFEIKVILIMSWKWDASLLQINNLQLWQFEIGQKVLLFLKYNKNIIYEILNCYCKKYLQLWQFKMDQKALLFKKIRQIKIYLWGTKL